MSPAYTITSAPMLHNRRLFRVDVVERATGEHIAGVCAIRDEADADAYAAFYAEHYNCPAPAPLAPA